jgi:hypothetical protein
MTKRAIEIEEAERLLLEGKEPLHVHNDPLPADAAPAVVPFTEEPLN